MQLQLAFQYASKSGHVRLAHEISVLIEHRTPCYNDSEDQDDDEVTPSDHTRDYPVSSHNQHNQLHNGYHNDGTARPRSSLQTNNDRPKFSLLKIPSRKASK